MEGILGIVGAITGVEGLVIAIMVTKWQAKVHAKEIAEERAYLEARLGEERAYSERLARLAFLSDRIFDLSIPRDLRLPFYEEYISMKGNGTAVRFWLAEESKARAEK